MTDPIGTAAPAGSSRTCLECGEIAQPDARFCEACGADLPAAAAEPTPPTPDVASARTTPAVRRAESASATRPAACRECGGEFDPDGYCTTCGAKAPNGRDHLVEQAGSWVAAVSDRGIRHRRNEDAFAVAADPEPGSRAVLVVCDGVSSAQDSDVASLAAAEAARAVLVGSRARGLGTEGALLAVITARLADAADAAARAVVEATSPAHAASPPSCTFVAAVLEGRQIVAGVVGDSRAYWLPDLGEAVGLTVDDSWAAELVAAGMPRAQAEAGPQAHAITRWLGVDAPDHRPRVTHVVAESPGWLLVCSDGLWNYCSQPADLAALVSRTAAAAGGEPLATASALVDWANAQGGHDNITVALARLNG